jgi:hypothetical protein
MLRHLSEHIRGSLRTVGSQRAEIAFLDGSIYIVYKFDRHRKALQPPSHEIGLQLFITKAQLQLSLYLRFVLILGHQKYAEDVHHSGVILEALRYTVHQLCPVEFSSRKASHGAQVSDPHLGRTVLIYCFVQLLCEILGDPNARTTHEHRHHVLVLCGLEMRRLRRSQI